MAIKQVYHQNLIGHEINESIQEEYDSKDREIFCKKLHKITEPDEKDCDSCPYFAGFMMGHGHECVWEDVIDTDEDTKIIPHQDARKEMYRVSKLIDEGILKKG